MLDIFYTARRAAAARAKKTIQQCAPVTWESLENRQLLSASPGFGPAHDHGGSGGGGGPGHGPPPGGPGIGATIEFSQAPTVVQTGLTTLSGTDGVTAPVATSTIHLANVGGIEIYTYDTNSTGTDTKVSVDQNGDPVTAPTHSTTTFGAITDTAVTDEITAIASALNLTAPTSTTSVDVLTRSDGSAIYSLALTPAATSTTTSDDHHEHGALVSVDSDGNPVGQERVPLSVLSTVVQTGLTSNAPTGATALDATSLIDVNTLDGVTLYTAHYTSTGTDTRVTVNTAGTLTSLPSTKQVTFTDLPLVAQNELQALAAADGYTSTIAATQAVTEFIEANGTIVYTIHLTVTSTDTSSDDINLTLSVDALGNPTVPPGDGGGIGRRGPGDGGHKDGDGDDDRDSGSGSGSSSSGSSDRNSGSDCDSGGSSSSGSSDSSSSGSTDSSGSSDSGSSSGSSSTGLTVGGSTSTTTSAASPTVTTTTTTTPPTKAELRAEAKAAAKAARLAKAAARKAAALAAKQARIAARAARLAAKLATRQSTT